jgi:hypothetical protein
LWVQTLFGAFIIKKILSLGISMACMTLIDQSTNNVTQNYLFSNVESQIKSGNVLDSPIVQKY